MGCHVSGGRRGAVAAGDGGENAMPLTCSGSGPLKPQPGWWQHHTHDPSGRISVVKHLSLRWLGLRFGEHTGQVVR